MTYLLVRNGESLYRLYIDLNVWPRLFMRLSDVAGEVPADERSWDRKQREANEQHTRKRTYAAMLAVQGILERSTLLHPLPEGPTPNVLRGHPLIVFLRDDEAPKLLTDASDPLAHLSWPGYVEWLRAQMDIGVRVIVRQPWHWTQDDKLYERIAYVSKQVTTWPSLDEVYTLDEVRRRGGSYRDFGFLYQPGRWSYVDGERKTKRRVRFYAFSDEILPVDFMSWRVLEHLIRDRGQRDRHNEFFWLAARWWKIAKAEAARERPFVDLVLAQADADSDDDRARVERLLRWWKLKTKEHRTLGTDEAKALRMILAAFRRGGDFTDDPEHKLMQQLRGGQ